jgi:nitroreductase
MMTVDEAIRTKRAVRQFAPTPLPDDAVRAILNAGRRAQSSKNTQPWVSTQNMPRLSWTAEEILSELSGK